jgi:hydroxyacylglutathione hydrolase
MENAVALEVRLFPCLSDNYAILLQDQATGDAATIDTPDADVILDAAQSLGWRLTRVFNTHWHQDHAGGNAAVKSATGAIIYGPPEVARIAPLDHAVAEGQIVELGASKLTVLDTPGHTNGHVCFHSPDDRLAFVGDTLFAMGCGRLFEGTAQTMWTSLSKLAALPDETLVYCAHEYTASNARFALSIDQDDAVAARCQGIFDRRSRGEATVPTTIGLEKATNPFLRAAKLASSLGAFTSPAEAFALVRGAKDGFKG